jgi:plasmid stability protein
MIKQITLRQVPDAVERGIRGRARSTGHSMNRAMIELLEEALGTGPAARKRRDLSKFAGQWSQEEYDAFESNTLVFEQIDDETWKS